MNIYKKIIFFTFYKLFYLQQVYQTHYIAILFVCARCRAFSPFHRTWFKEKVFHFQNRFIIIFRVDILSLISLHFLAVSFWQIYYLFYFERITNHTLAFVIYQSPEFRLPSIHVCRMWFLWYFRNQKKNLNLFSFAFDIE